jgi:diguanylate cyclase
MQHQQDPELLGALARRLQQELFEVRSALAQARAELLRLQSCEREARQRALEDGLTALPNQGAFRSHLSHNVDHASLVGSSLAVLYLDLDNFKLINDAHGHDVGDMLLRIVAVRLRSALRRGDIVGRLGGDEFACLLVGSPSRQALTRRVTKLEQTLMAPVQVGDLVLQVRASVGIAVWPEDGHTGDDLLRNADRAMYAVKRQRCGQEFIPHDLAHTAAPLAAEINLRIHH